MNSKYEAIYQRLAPGQQKTDGIKYVMRLRFALIISFMPNDLLPDTMGNDESIAMTENATYHTTKIMDFLPDDETIKAYEKELKIAFNENPDRKARLVRLMFDGYDYIYAVKRKEEAPGVPKYNALKQLVKLAYENKAITIIANPDGDGETGPVLKIGNTWLYFDSRPESEAMTPQQYIDTHDISHIIYYMADAIWNLWETDKEDPEPAYIFACLYENIEDPEPYPTSKEA